MKKKGKDELKDWHWPYLRYSDGPEYACPHGVGHGHGVHGCDGCCRHPSFKISIKRILEKSDKKFNKMYKKLSHGGYNSTTANEYIEKNTRRKK